MKKLFSWFFNHLSAFLLVIALICIYAVLQIKFGCFWTVGEIDDAESVNSIIESLSFSYIAAYLFYVLTIAIPRSVRRRKLTPIIRGSVKNIGVKDIRSVLLNFYRGTGFPLNYRDTEHTAEILKTKNWDEVIPLYKRFEGIDVTYFKYVCLTSQQIQERVSSIISRYKEDLSVDQLVALENFSNMVFFIMVEFLSNHSKILVNDGRDSIIEEFVKMQKAYLEIENLFGIS